MTKRLKSNATSGKKQSRTLRKLEEPVYVSVGSLSDDGLTVKANDHDSVKLDDEQVKIHKWLGVPRTISEMEAHGYGHLDSSVEWLVERGLVAMLYTQSALFTSFNDIRVVPDGNVDRLSSNTFELVPYDASKEALPLSEPLATVLSSTERDLPQAIRSASVQLITPAERVAFAVFDALYSLLDDGYVHLMRADR